MIQKGALVIIINKKFVYEKCEHTFHEVGVGESIISNLITLYMTYTETK